MAKEAARVAGIVNELVENQGTHLDLSSCYLNSFPTGLFLALHTVSGNIVSICLANNELKSLPGKFFSTFSNLQELDLEGNQLEKLPDAISNLQKLKVINLCKNKFEIFPEQLTRVQCLENINLESNQIKDIPMEDLSKMPHLSSVNVKQNPVSADTLKACAVKFQLLV